MAVAPTSSNDFSTISAMFLGVWVAHWEPSKHKDLRTSVLQFGAKTTKTRQLRNTVSTLRKKKTVAAAMIFDALEPGLWLAPNGLTREWWMLMWGKKHNNHHPRHNGWKIKLIFETCRGLSEKVLPHSIHWFIMMFLSKNWCHWCFTDFQTLQTLQTPSCASFSSRSLVAFCAWCEWGS